MWLEPCAGLGRHREAALALEEGLRLDPFDWPLKQALEAATQGILRDLVEGAFPAASPVGFFSQCLWSRMLEQRV